VGASLVSAALINVCPALGRNHASRVALLIMANAALDRDAQPVYWAGWKPIARALGLAGSERTQHHRVTKILGELADLGVVECVVPSAPGRNARYALYLGHLRLVHSVDNPPQEDPQPVDNTDVTTANAWS
jgi:hypothetical protein